MGVGFPVCHMYNQQKHLMKSMNYNSDKPDNIANELENWQVKFPTKKEESWQAIQGKIGESKETPIYAINRGWKKFAVAASIALALGLAFFMSGDSEKVFQTAAMETLEIKLPDNSVVLVNANSTLSYDESDWDGNRRINLDGEAYFEVEPGSKFKVITSNGSVQVLGTGFNVFNRNNSFKVGCTHGKVEVKAGEDQVILTKGLYSEWIDREFTAPLERDHIKAWTDGEFHFEETTLAEVFAEIERQFDVIVDHNIDVERMYTGSFKSGSIENAMTIVCEPMNLTFTVPTNGDKTILINDKTN